MISNQLNPDRFGYYTVGDRRTYSKLQAIEWHTQTGHHPEWHFNEESFDRHDWTKDPQTSLRELYRQRAQHLRDQYDYLVLMYSGGSDSDNILDTFVDNNIKLDECASFWAQEGEDNLNSFFGKEIAHVAIPKMKKLPGILHRVIDQTKLTEQVYLDSNVKFDWIYFMNTYFSPNNYVRSHFRQLVPEYRRLIDSGKSVCFIWGAEKPRLHRVDGRYCVRFQDLVDNTVSPWLQQNAQPGEHDELFYWSPDFTTGIIKQSHAIMNYLKTAKINTVDFTDQSQTCFYGSTERNGKTWQLTADGINQLIYPTWDIGTISVGKARSPMWSERDDWFFKTIGYNTAGRNFINSLTKLDQILSLNNSYWKNRNDDFLSGIKGCLTKCYFLE